MIQDVTLLHHNDINKYCLLCEPKSHTYLRVGGWEGRSGEGIWASWGSDGWVWYSYCDKKISCSTYRSCHRHVEKTIKLYNTFEYTGLETAADFISGFLLLSICCARGNVPALGLHLSKHTHNKTQICKTLLAFFSKWMPTFDTIKLIRGCILQHS